MEPLKCTKIIVVEKGRNNQGKKISIHQQCGEPAAEYVIGGLLTTAKAVLCARHKALADRQNFISSNGYAYGKVDRRAVRKEGYAQTRLPGTGVHE